MNLDYYCDDDYYVFLFAVTNPHPSYQNIIQVLGRDSRHNEASNPLRISGITVYRLKSRRRPALIGLCWERGFVCAEQHRRRRLCAANFLPQEFLRPPLLSRTQLMVGGRLAYSHNGADDMVHTRTFRSLALSRPTRRVSEALPPMGRGLPLGSRNKGASCRLPMPRRSFVVGWKQISSDDRGLSAHCVSAAPLAYVHVWPGEDS